MKYSTLGALCAGLVLSSALSTAHAVSVVGQGTWETTLQGRDLDGNLATFEAYYDTAQNITWLADANYAGVGMSWTTADAWATNLNPYGSGIAGWRLPTTIDADGPDADAFGNDGCDQTPSLYQGLDCGYNITAHSEMSHMFYVTLGDMAYYRTTGTAAQPGWGLTNTGPFSNIQSNNYWSATLSPSTAPWMFHFSTARQATGGDQSNVRYAWAVHSGDVGVSAVPVPAAAWLFGSGLLGLVGISRKCRR
ncbi:MAG: DUF1566 domain-containing protein [Gammaproteobacteria bacterium]|nr:DUF1566 domain-containing protein [Gammaproteobacteria bacterium]